nr:hypothetical protein [Tanacetum cinerariifolium]
MTRSQNHDASSSKKFNACDNNASTSWANLNQDLLLSIMMQLGVVDFFSFKRVCKLWRKLAFDHNDMFMGSRQPMSISFSTGAKKECYLEDFEGRKFKTILPHSIGSTCVGITCGYVILFGRKTRDFWLVNPITRHEFHFSSFPFYVRTQQLSGRSLSMYLECLEPTLRLLTMKNIPEPRLLRPEFENSDQNLYVIDCILKDMYESHEVDFDEMKWVSMDNTIKDYSFFVSDLKSGAVINPETWVDPQTQYEGIHYSRGYDRYENKGGWFTVNMWYFPHDC